MIGQLAAALRPSAVCAARQYSQALRLAMATAICSPSSGDRRPPPSAPNEPHMLCSAAGIALVALLHAAERLGQGAVGEGVAAVLLRGHQYQARLLAGAELTANPLNLLAYDLAGVDDVGQWSLVVAGRG